MSQRPKEAVDQASRFSLRHIFGGQANQDDDGTGAAAEMDAQQQQQQQQYQLQMQQYQQQQQQYAAYYAQQQQQHQQTSQAPTHAQPYAPVAPVAVAPQPAAPALSAAQETANIVSAAGQRAQLAKSFKFTFGGSTGGGTAGGAAAGGGGGLRFNLPSIGGCGNAALAASPPASSGGGGGDGAATAKALRAGFLTGGAASGADASAEVLRLNAIVDELTTKLTRSQERCQNIEHSIHKGNVSVTAERQQHEQRLAALQAELQGAQEREIALGAQLAQLPKRQEHELERFRIQAQGAVELQSKYDEAAKKLEALEAEAAFLRQGHARATAAAASTGEHNQKIVAELASAQAQLEVTQNRAAGLATEVEQLRAQLDGAAPGTLGGDDAGANADPATAAATRAVATISELEAFVDQVRDDCAVAVEEAQAAAAAVCDSTNAQSTRLSEMQSSLLEAETAATAAAQELKLAVARAEVAEAHGASAQQTAECACAKVRKEAAEAAAEAARQAVVAVQSAEAKARAEGRAEGKVEGKAEAANAADAAAAAVPVAVPVVATAHASLEELDAELVDAHYADKPRSFMLQQIETVLEAQRLHAPRCTAADAVHAIDGALPLRLEDFTSTGISHVAPTATKGDEDAAETQQTVEQRARVQKLVAAISQDLKVFVMDSTLKWKAAALGAPALQVQQLTAPTAA